MRKIRIAYNLILIGVFISAIFSHELLQADPPKEIEIIRTEQVPQKRSTKRYTTEYGSFKIIEAPIKSLTWSFDKLIQGVGGLGSLAIDGLAYPFRLIHRKQSNEVSHEKEKKVS